MTHDKGRIRRLLFAAAKIALAIGLLSYLLFQAGKQDMFTQLAEKPKRWPLLAAGLACAFTNITLSFVRWHFFVRGIGIPIRFVETMRLGALGFALNFVSLGSIGGDLFKAIFLAHGQPGRRTEAVASVLADRVLGLLTILSLASGGILSTDLMDRAPPALLTLCRTILITNLVVLVAVGLALLVPALSGPAIVLWAKGLPIVGDTASRLLAAIHAYRTQPYVLLAAAAISLVGNTASIVGFYFMACGLPIERPTFREHFVVVPIANMVSAIPATPSGLGTKEAAADLLYRIVPADKNIPEGVGTLAALAYRACEILVAMVGLVYYLSHRKELAEVVAEVEELENTG